MLEQIVFAIFSFILIGLTFYQYRSMRNALSATVLMVITCAMLAFYMLQFGSLGSFTMKGLSAEASFIREKSVEAQVGVDKIAKIQSEVEKDRGTIASVVSEIRDGDEKIKKAQVIVNNAEEKVNQIQRILQEADAKLKQVESISDLNLLLVKLENSDRTALTVC